MPLKFRYASLLLLVLVLVALFGAATVYFLKNGSYLLTICLLALLYLITYQLGRKFSRIFLLLSFLRKLKQLNGVISLEKYQDFIGKALAGRRNTNEKERLIKDVLETMVANGIVTFDGSTITLVAE